MDTGSEALVERWPERHSNLGDSVAREMAKSI